MSFDISQVQCIAKTMFDNGIKQDKVRNVVGSFYPDPSKYVGKVIVTVRINVLNGQVPIYLMKEIMTTEQFKLLQRAHHVRLSAVDEDGYDQVYDVPGECTVTNDPTKIMNIVNDKAKSLTYKFLFGPKKYSMNELLQKLEMYESNRIQCRRIQRS